MANKTFTPFLGAIKEMQDRVNNADYSIIKDDGLNSSVRSYYEQGTASSIPEAIKADTEEYVNKGLNENVYITDNEERYKNLGDDEMAKDLRDRAIQSWYAVDNLTAYKVPVEQAISNPMYGTPMTSYVDEVKFYGEGQEIPKGATPLSQAEQIDAKNKRREEIIKTEEKFEFLSKSDRGKELLKDVYNNPNITSQGDYMKAINQAYSQYESEGLQKFVGTEIDRLDSEIAKLEEKNKKPYNFGRELSKATWGAYEGAREDKDLLRAKELLEEVKTSYQHLQEGAGFWKGLGNELFSWDTFTLGVESMLDNADIARHLNKFAEVGFDGLTETEKVVLDALIAREAMNSLPKGFLYNAGEAVGFSIPFMISYGLSKIPSQAIAKATSKATGEGIKKLGEYLSKRAAKEGASQAIKKADDIIQKGVKKATDFAQANPNLTKWGKEAGEVLTTGAMTSGIQTVTSPHTYGDYAERQAQVKYEVDYDDNGNVQIVGKGVEQDNNALAKAITSAFIDNMSEKVGGLLIPDGATTFMGKEIKSLVKNNISPRQADFFKKVSAAWNNNPMREAAKAVDFGSFGQEFGEEIVAGVGNTLFVGDQTFEELFSGENMLTTALSIGAMSTAIGLIGGAINANEFRKSKRNYEESLRQLEQSIPDVATRNKIINQIATADYQGQNNLAQSIMATAREEAKKGNNREAQVLAERARNVVRFANAYNQVSVWNQALNVKLEERMKTERDHIKQNANADMDNHTIIAQYEGENYLVVGGKVAFNQDGTIDLANSSESVTIKSTDGEKQIISPEKLSLVADMSFEELDAQAQQMTWQRMEQELNTPTEETQPTQEAQPVAEQPTETGQTPSSTGAETTPENTQAEQPQQPSYPTDEEGEPLFTQMPIEQTNQVINELGENADTFVSNKINEAQSRLEKAQNAKVKATKFNEMKREAEAINQEKQAAQTELDYWTQVQQARSQSGVSNAEVNEIVNETSEQPNGTNEEQQESKVTNEGAIQETTPVVQAETEQPNDLNDSNDTTEVESNLTNEIDETQPSENTEQESNEANTTEETQTESLGEENSTEETRQRVTEEEQTQVAPMQLTESDRKSIQAEATRIEKGIRKMARELRKEWKGKDIYILEDMTDVFQRKFRQQIKENGLIGAIALNAKEEETAKQTLKRMLSPKFRGIFDGMNGEEIITSFSSHGFFKDSTGKVYVNMSANLNAEDLKVTLFHEAVAHKGLRELLGKDNFAHLCQAVAEAMPTEIKERLIKAYSESGSTITDALIADEYMASLAEQMAENNGELTIPQRIVGAMRNFFRNLFNLKLNEADIKYLLYASYKKLKGDEGIQTSINNSATLKRLRDVAVTQQAEEAVRNRLVYHGSGAEFERFDHNYMGTGEGLQAFGWGTYVTDVEEIGRTYAEDRVKNVDDEINRIISALKYHPLGAYYDSLEEAKQSLNSLIDNFKDDEYILNNGIKELSSLIKEWENLEKYKQNPPRHLYNVDIPDDNGSNYLHWEEAVPSNVVNTVKERLFDEILKGDKEGLYEGVEKELKKELENTFKDLDIEGGKLYGSISSYLGGDKEASQFLSSLGFVGISYPAQLTTGGRADGARNFVIFNEDDAQIVEHTRFRMSSTPEEFEAIQKQAVAENGIVMPNLNQMRVKVVDVPEHDFKGTLKQARNEAKQWATENYTDKEFDLPEEGGKYVISKRAINKYLDETAIAKSDNASIHLSTLKRLPEIISESVDVEIHPDYKKGENKLRSIDNGVGNPDLLVHRMYGAIEIGENTYRVKTTMHEFKNKNFATTPHSYEVTKIELIESPTTDESNSPLDVSTNSITATKLLQGVEKSYDKGKKILEESKNTNPNIRFRLNEELDEPYFNAIERGDMEEVERLVNEAARNAGYDSLSDYQGSLAFNGAAPSSNAYYTTKEERKEAWENGNFEGDMSLGDYADNNIDTHDLGWILTDPRALMNEPNATRESIYNLRNTIREGKRTIKMYRAVDAKIKEESFRNGDWITPSREYAQYHITLQDWDKGRIIEQEVSIDDIWWNGDDINEWGYDDGKEYAYKNTKNNKKSTDLMTYDDNGDIIPLSKRFNYRNPDIRFRFIGEQGAMNIDKAEEATIRLDNLNIARAMEEEGKDAKTIKLATGWERGADNKWRYEVADDYEFETPMSKIGRLRNELKDIEKRYERLDYATRGRLPRNASDEQKERMKKLRKEFKDVSKQASDKRIEMYDTENSMGGVHLKEFIGEDNKLFKAYPQLADYYISFVRKYNYIDAGYNGYYSDRTIWINPYLEESKIKSVFAHEIQHAIQHIEGFAQGGNAETANALRDKARAWSWRNALMETAKEYPELAGRKDLEQKLIEEYKNESLEQYIPSEEQRIKGFNLYVLGYDNEGYEEAYEQMSKIGLSNNDNYRAYRKLSGEVESRNVQSRMDMTPEERRQSLASETEDVSRKDQIFIYDGLDRANEDGVNFHLSEETDNILTSIEQRNAEAYNSVMNVELPKAETPMEIARNKKVEVMFRRFTPDQDFAVNNPATMFASANAMGFWDKQVENYWDSFITLKKYEDAIEKAYGVNLAQLGMSAYIGENTSQSRAQTRSAEFNQTYEKKLADTLKPLYKEIGEQQMKWYAIARTGLERQAIKEAEARAKAQAEGKQYHRMDYAGLTGLLIEMMVSKGLIDNKQADTLKEWSLTKVEQFAEKKGVILSDYIQEIENKMGEETISNLWSIVREIADEKLKLQLESGLLSTRGYILLMHGVDIKPILELNQNYGYDKKLINSANLRGMTPEELLNNGIIEQHQYDIIINGTPTYQYYLPLKGNTELTAEDLVNYEQKTAKNMASIKEAKGHKNIANNPFVQLINDAYGSISASEHNRWLRSLLRTAQQFPSDAIKVSTTMVVPMTQVLPDGTQQLVYRVATQDDIERGWAETIDNKMGIEELHITKAQYQEHTVLVRDGGQAYTLEIQNHALAEAINTLGGRMKDKNGWIAKNYDKLNRIYASLKTSLNPAFVLPNMARDYGEALTNNSIIFGTKAIAPFSRAVEPASELSRGLHEYLHLRARGKMGEFKADTPVKKLVKEFFDNGGETNYNMLSDYDTQRAKLKQMMNLTQWDKTKNASSEAWKTYFGVYGNYVELMSRLATYAINRGTVDKYSMDEVQKSEQEAIFAAKEITTNFDKRGKNNKDLGRVIMFFNAGRQSNRNHWRLMKEHPLRYGLNALLMPFLAQLAMPHISAVVSMLLGDDDKDYNDYIDAYNTINKHIKSKNFVLMLGDHVLKVPVSPSFAPMLALGNAVNSVIFPHRNGADFGDFVVSMLDCWTSVASIGGVFSPVGEAIINRDYADAPIYREGERFKTLPSWHRAYDDTPELLINLNKFLNRISGGNSYTIGSETLDRLSNPGAVYHILTSWGGGYAEMANSLIRLCDFVSLPNEADALKRGGDVLKRTLIVNRFYAGNINDYIARDVEDAYWEIRELQATVRNGAKQSQIPVAYQNLNNAINSSPALDAYEAILKQSKRVDARAILKREIVAHNPQLAKQILLEREQIENAVDQLEEKNFNYGN